MRRSFLVAALALFPGAAFAQIEGLRLEGGAAFLTKSGSFTLGKSEIESDAGRAIRGRLRYGWGAVSIGADVQSSSQDYGTPAAAGAPQNLGATFLGVVGALHPVKILGFVPYAELGIGKLFLKDDSISQGGGTRASSVGFGIYVGGDRLGLDAELRLLRESGLTAPGAADEFKYDPKVFSVMLSIRI